MNAPTVLIIENYQTPISEETKQKIFGRYKGFKFETITDDTHAYKRTLTNRFDIAFIDVNFCGSRFDAFDIIRGCVLSGKPVVIVRHTAKDNACKLCDDANCADCSVIETCNVTSWNELQSVEEVTDECPLNCHVNLKTIFDQLKK